MSQLIGYCVIEYLKLERKRKFKYTCPYDQLLCMGFTAFGARGFLPSIHLRVLVRTHNKLNFIGADSVAPKVFQSEWEVINHCIQGAVVSVAFTQAHDVLVLDMVESL